MKMLQSRVAILVLLLLSAGCATTKSVDPRITVTGAFLASNIEITDVSWAANQSGFMEIQVTGINKTSSYKQLEYSIEWLDQSGMNISTIMSRWTKFPAYANAEFRFKAVAPKTTAVDYRVLIRK